MDEALLTQHPDVLVVTGRDGRVVHWSHGATVVLGHAVAEALDQPLTMLLAPEEGVQVPRRAIATLQDRGDGRAEVVVRHRDGSLLCVDFVTRRLRGALTGHVLWAGRDVTPPTLVRSARHLRARYGGLLEAAPDAMVIVDADGRIVLANSQTAALFGYACEELIGYPVEMLLPEAFRAAHVAHRRDFAAHPRTRAMGAGLALYAMRRSGEAFPVEISLSPIRTADGTLTSAAIRDITARKAVERRLQEQNLRLAQANEATTNFLAGMSHELRTPLNAIIGFTGTLLMQMAGPLNEEQDKQLRTVQWAAQHLLTLINDLLDLTRIESGETHVERAPVPAVTVARDVATQLRGQAEDKGLALEVDLPDDEIVLLSDRRALSQILMNLLANAVKYTDMGGVRFMMRRTPSCVRFEVSDTGIGIRAEDRERLFKAFSRLERGNDTRQGTGLGLYLSARLAALLGGRIEFDSTVGTGSTFRLILPED
jgi:PAS domain S-box-containing protein